MEAKERNVEAWAVVLLMDVNDYLPSDDLPFPLLLSGIITACQTQGIEMSTTWPVSFFFSFLLTLHVMHVCNKSAERDL